MSDINNKNKNIKNSKKIDDGIDPKSKCRIFFDLDGTLATWGKLEYEEQLFEQGYFKNLPPMKESVKQANSLIEQGYDVYILSKYLEDSKYALNEKKEWVAKYLPQIKPENCIYVKYSENKSDCIPHGINRNDFLIDDYSPNLFEFCDAGGQAIKILNGINHTKGTWKGERIEWKDPHFSEKLLKIIDMNLIELKLRIIAGVECYEYNVSSIKDNDVYKGYVIKNKNIYEMKEDLYKNKSFLDKKDFSKISVILKDMVKKVSESGLRIIWSQVDVKDFLSFYEEKYKGIIKREAIVKKFKDSIAEIEDMDLKGFRTSENEIEISPEFLEQIEFSNFYDENNVDYHMTMYQLTNDKQELEIACELEMPDEYKISEKMKYEELEIEK